LGWALLARIWGINCGCIFVPYQFIDLVVEKFGTGKGTIIATPEQMLHNELIYIPKYSLSATQINGLINGIPGS
jgi:hypothetical protein